MRSEIVLKNSTLDECQIYIIVLEGCISGYPTDLSTKDSLDQAIDDTSVSCCALWYWQLQP